MTQFYNDMPVPVSRVKRYYPGSIKQLLFVLIATQLGACQVLGLRGFSFPPRVGEEPEPTIRHIESYRFPFDKKTDVVGQLATLVSRSGDTLPDVGRHFGLGYNDITAANPGLKVWVPRPGQRVVLPLQFILPDSPRRGIILNLPNMRLFHYQGASTEKSRDVVTYSIGIGRQGWSTPTGKTRIVQKRANPSWTVPASIRQEHARDGDPLPRIVKAGPDNPLGRYALRLSMPSYLIHGTNKPYGVGMRISHGCVRLYPENIEKLFHNVKVGTKVRIINQPYLIGWKNNMLYLEANEPIIEKSINKTQFKSKLLKKLKKESKNTVSSIDYAKVDRVLNRADGIPTPILRNSPRITQIIASADIIAHPRHFFGKPTIPAIKADDWTGLADTFPNKADAQKLVEILTHQGPSIPAHINQVSSRYQVIVGPFKTKKLAKITQSRVAREFGIKMKIIPPLI